jgi:prepilin-type processing-associated H-X9-DG protein
MTFSNYHYITSSPLAAIVCNFAFADGSVRAIAQDVSPQIIEGLFTIRGGEDVLRVGED